MSWRDRMASYDTETDSANPEDARIISACIGWASADGWQARTWLLQPERDIAESATAVHGITTEMARIDGVPREQGLREIREALTAAWASGAPVVIFNAPFDTTVTDRELRRIGETGLTCGPIVDGLTIDKAIDKWRKGSRKLIDAAAHYGITLDGAHDATADALAAARLAWVLAGRLPEELRDDLAQLHAWQEAQYREQRLSFAEYRRRKGQPLDDESTDWPIRPHREEEV